MASQLAPPQVKSPSIPQAPAPPLPKAPAPPPATGQSARLLPSSPLSSNIKDPTVNLPGFMQAQPQAKPPSAAAGNTNTSAQLPPYMQSKGMPPAAQPRPTGMFPDTMRAIGGQMANPNSLISTLAGPLQGGTNPNIAGQAGTGAVGLVKGLAKPATLPGETANAVQGLAGNAGSAVETASKQLASTGKQLGAQAAQNPMIQKQLQQFAANKPTNQYEAGHWMNQILDWAPKMFGMDASTMSPILKGLMSIGGPIAILLLLSKLLGGSKQASAGYTPQQLKQVLLQFGRMTAREKQALWLETLVRRDELEARLPRFYKLANYPGCKSAPRTSRIAKVNKPEVGPFGKGHKYQGSSVKKARWFGAKSKSPGVAVPDSFTTLEAAMNNLYPMYPGKSLGYDLYDARIFAGSSEMGGRMNDITKKHPDVVAKLKALRTMMGPDDDDYDDPAAYNDEAATQLPLRSTKQAWLNKLASTPGTTKKANRGILAALAKLTPEQQLTLGLGGAGAIGLGTAGALARPNKDRGESRISNALSGLAVGGLGGAGLGAGIGYGVPWAADQMGQVAGKAKVRHAEGQIRGGADELLGRAGLKTAAKMPRPAGLPAPAPAPTQTRPLPGMRPTGIQAITQGLGTAKPKTAIPGPGPFRTPRAPRRETRRGGLAGLAQLATAGQGMQLSSHLLPTQPLPALAPAPGQLNLQAPAPALPRTQQSVLPQTTTKASQSHTRGLHKLVKAAGRRPATALKLLQVQSLAVKLHN